ncbi:MAG: hypothetical protein O9296_02070 [Novosphingobium sp.]|nr:hypothetical protein [Novosphingobium sp.]
MIRKFVFGLVAATALFAVEAATFQAEAQQRRRGAPEVRVSRPNWLVTPKVSFPGDRLSARPDLIYSNIHPNGDPMVMSTSMRGARIGPDRFWGGPANMVNWPWPAAFYARN